MRKAIVTGAYGAIGKAIAKGGAEAAYDVTLIGAMKQRLKPAAASWQIKPGIATFPGCRPILRKKTKSGCKLPFFRAIKK